VKRGVLVSRQIDCGLIWRRTLKRVAEYVLSGRRRYKQRNDSRDDTFSKGVKKKSTPQAEDEEEEELSVEGEDQKKAVGEMRGKESA
jgi:hypothetical protein